MSDVCIDGPKGKMLAKYNRLTNTVYVRLPGNREQWRRIYCHLVSDGRGGTCFYYLFKNERCYVKGTDVMRALGW